MIKIKSIISSYLHWFYAPLNTSLGAILRGAIYGLLLYNLVIILPDVDALFSDQGVISNQALLPSKGALIFPLNIFFLVSNLTTLWTVTYCLILLCLLSIYGWGEKTVAASASVLYIALIHRFPLSPFNQMVPSLHLAVLAPFLPSFRNAKKRSGQTFTYWPVRCIQLYTALIYLSTAVTKLRSPVWLNGSEVTYILNSSVSMWNSEWLFHFPLVGELSCLFAVAVELAAFMFIWHHSLRLWCIGGLIVLHIGIFLTLDVINFSETMLVCIMSFLTIEDLGRLRGIKNRYGQRKSLPIS